MNEPTKQIPPRVALTTTSIDEGGSYQRPAVAIYASYIAALEAVGLAHDNQCRFPLTQTELGDAVALSAVHINRTLMGMRRAGLVRLHGGRLELLDRRALQAAGGFDPSYLHLPSGTATAPAEEAAMSARSVRMRLGLEGTNNAG